MFVSSNLNCDTLSRKKCENIYFSFAGNLYFQPNRSELLISLLSCPTMEFPVPYIIYFANPSCHSKIFEERSTVYSQFVESSIFLKNECLFLHLVWNSPDQVNSSILVNRVRILTIVKYFRPTLYIPYANYLKLRNRTF